MAEVKSINENPKREYCQNNWGVNGMRKIVQVSSYYPPRLGGMQNVVRELSERLAADGQEVEVYTSTIGTNTGRIASTKNLNIKYFWGFDIAHTAIMPMLFFRLLLISRNSVMHIHTPRPYTAEIAALAAKIRGIPYIVQVHSDIQPLGLLKFLIPSYKKIVWGWVMRGAATVVFLSASHEAEFKKLYSLQRTAVIPNGVDDKYFIKRSAPSPPLRLLFVGRLNNQKNIPFLVEAVSLMKQTVSLDIVGEGEMQEELSYIIKNKRLADKVILQGKKTGDELINFYRNANIYIMASHFEGLSLAMLEAMAAGLPVVAVNAPGVSEFIQNCGIVVKDATPKSFAARLDDTVKDLALLAQLSQQSQKEAQHYQWPKVISEFNELYQRCGENV